MSKIKLYVGYWLITLSYYKYRKVFAHDWLILKETFKVISHHDDNDNESVTSNNTVYE